MSDPVDDFDPQLDERISELRTILSLVQLSGPVVVQTTVDLIDLLRQRAERDDDGAVVDEALQVAHHALAMLPPDHEARLGVLVEQALTLEHRFDRNGDAADLDAAIGIWRGLADPDVPAPRASVAVATAQLGCLLRLRLSLLVETADDETVAAAMTDAQQTLQAARDMLPEDAPNLAETCWLLGLCWGDRYEIDRDPYQLDRAIAEIGDSLRLAPDSAGDRTLAMAGALHERAATRWAAAANEVTDQIRGDLTEAVDLVRTALGLIGPDSPLYVDALWEAVTIGVTQLDASPDTVDLAELTAWTDQLGAHYDVVDPQRSDNAAQAAVAIQARVFAASVSRDPGNTPADASRRLPEFLRLVARLMETGDSFTAPDLTGHPRVAMLLRPDLVRPKFEEFVRKWRDMPPGPERAEAGGMAVVLQLTLHQRGLMDLDAPTAIAMATDALTTRRDDVTWQSQIGLVLASLLTMHAHVAQPAQIQSAIDVLEKIASEDPAVREQIAALRTTALQVRAARSHEIADLQAALVGTERLLRTTPPEDELHLSIKSQLGALLVSLGHARSDTESLRRGVELLRQCVDTMPEQDTRRGGVLTNLAMGEVALMRPGPAAPEDVARLANLIDAAANAPGRTPELEQQLDLLRPMLPMLTEDASTLVEAVDRLRDSSPNPGDPGLLRHRIAVGGGLAARAEARRDYADAEAAVHELETVRADLASDFRHPLWSEATLMLGRAYRLRADLAEPGADRAADRDRSRHQGLLALRGQAWRALVQSNTDNAVAGARDAAAMALEVAGWCVHDRAATDAATAIDAGRGLILHAASVSPQFGAASTDPQSVGADPRSRRLWALLGETGDVVASPVLSPPLLEEVQRALRTVRAHALIYLVGQSDDLTPVAVVLPDHGEPSIVDLPTGGPAPPEFVTALAGNDFRAGRDADIAGQRPAGPPHLHDVLPSLTHWAWQAAMARVFDFCRQAGFTRPYRLILVPMGELAIVPWHAARSPSGRYALQDAVISYAASARLLCDVVGRSRIPVERGSLIVGNPTGDLPAAGEEAGAIRDRFYPHARYLGDSRTPAPATPREVLDWLAATVDDARGMLHLACHGVVGLSAAGSSRLVLADHADLWAEQLVESPAWKAGACQLGLACLAACSTGVAGRGYDEAFSLATAFQVAGARSVISSLWRVPDEATSLLMYLLHHYLVEDRVRSAEALRLAQLWMLDADRRVPPGMPATLASRLERLDPDEMATWAGFVHLGQW
jgi:hypothetical protein